MKILSAEQTRTVDTFTIENEPIKSIDLMERASKAFVAWFVKKFSTDKTVLIFAGPGNNGGDALAITRLLYNQQYKVKLLLVSINSKGSKNYKINLHKLPKKIALVEQADADCDIIIDGIFGSGIDRPFEGRIGTLIDEINLLGKPIVSIDIASGLSPDGIPLGDCVIKPDFTVSFQLPKLAFMMPENSEFVGEWRVIDIGLNNKEIERQKSNYHYFSTVLARKMVKPRLKYAHKGHFGHALIVGGSFGMIGANVLASKACLRAGSGLVTSLVPNCGYTILQTSFPEAMCLTSGEKHLINLEIENISNYSALGIGPGIGENLETLSLLLTLIKEYKKPMVLDADALNLIAQNPELIELLPKGSVLTPHVGEFNRLVGNNSHSLERIEKQKKFSEKHGLILVLKGAHSSISNVDGTVWFNSTGNPGMATAGSGDVLTGIITGLLAQGYTSFDAARLGVFIHGKAGDIASLELGEASVIASDIVQRIPSTFISLN
ncbi:MAG: NAD(P)H-hydrate dehydratase [Cyclobacteriaceae bacterium]|nr:NAD(P)H-hydrate dehydratase [Cyclobacteriaceae bacterium]